MKRWRSIVIRDPAELAGLAEWWDRQEGARGNVHLSRSLLERWEDGWFSEGSRLAVHVLLRSGEPVAALPLYSVGWRHFSLGRFWAEPIDLVGAEDAETQAHLPRWLRRIPYARVHNIPADSTLGTAVGQTRADVLEIPAWDLDLGPGFEVILRRVEAKDRNAAARKLRRLEKLGEVRFVEERDSLALFEEGLELEKAGWKGRDGTAVLTRPRDVAWMRSVVDVLREREQLRSLGLYVDDCLVSYGLSASSEGVWSGSVSAFDESPDIARLSPGYVLLVETLRRACAEGLSLYRLGTGTEQWKPRWATKQRSYQRALLLGSGLRGRSVYWKRRILGHQA